MKQIGKEFVLRGLMAFGFGPVVLAVIYLVLNLTGAAVTVTLADAAKGILTISIMAFVAAGVTVVYQVERLPLLTAILIHGGVLYLDYVMIYLVNGWLQPGWTPFAVFTLIFVAGYALVWLCVYGVNRRKTEQLNRKLRRHP